MISECPLSYLCKVIQNTRFGFDLFFGEIVSGILAENKIITQGINPSILVGREYWALGNNIGLVFRNFLYLHYSHFKMGIIPFIAPAIEPTTLNISKWELSWPREARPKKPENDEKIAPGSVFNSAALELEITVDVQIHNVWKVLELFKCRWVVFISSNIGFFICSGSVFG